jgi:hypothetical protein
VAIRRGADFTSQFRWILRVKPESTDTVLLTDSETRAQKACSLAEAIKRTLA